MAAAAAAAAAAFWSPPPPLRFLGRNLFSSFLLPLFWFTGAIKGAMRAEEEKRRRRVFTIGEGAKGNGHRRRRSGFWVIGNEGGPLTTKGREGEA